MWQGMLLFGLCVLPFSPEVGCYLDIEAGQAALETHANLSSSGAGGVSLDGVLTLLDRRTGGRNVTLAASELDLSRWLPRAPASRLNFTLAGRIAQDSGASPRALVMRSRYRRMYLAGPAP